MNTSVALRAASVLATVQYAAHSYLFLSAVLEQRPIDSSTIAAMKAQLVTGGRSYWDFYFGYGLLAILSGVVEIVLLWQLAAIAKDNPPRVRPIIALFMIFNVVHALLVWHYFRIVPAIAFDVLVTGVLAFAFVAANRRDA